MQIIFNTLNTAETKTTTLTVRQTIEAFETWMWKGMEMIRWENKTTDKVQKVKEERYLQRTIRQCEHRWIQWWASLNGPSCKSHIWSDAFSISSRYPGSKRGFSCPSGRVQYSSGSGTNFKMTDYTKPSLLASEWQISLNFTVKLYQSQY